MLGRLSPAWWLRVVTVLWTVNTSTVFKQLYTYVQYEHFWINTTILILHNIYVKSLETLLCQWDGVRGCYWNDLMPQGLSMSTLCQGGANLCNAKFIVNECKLLKHPNHMTGPEAGEERRLHTSDEWTALPGRAQWLSKWNIGPLTERTPVQNMSNLGWVRSLYISSCMNDNLAVDNGGYPQCPLPAVQHSTVLLFIRTFMSPMLR